VAMSRHAFAPAPGITGACRGSNRDCGVTRRLEDADAQLLGRTGAGDKQAFAALFSRYVPKLKSYLMRLGASAAAAEDVVQDAVVSVWRGASSYEAAKAKASTWMFVIARNAWVDRLRRENVELAYRSENRPLGQDDAPDDAAVRKSDEERIGAAMASLSETQRQVVRLSYVEDRPRSETGTRFSVPLGAVKSRLRLALARLRAHWEQYS
jgi:RNA polymerase sigma-70 factor (ECF subfamily)